MTKFTKSGNAVRNLREHKAHITGQVYVAIQFDGVEKSWEDWWNATWTKDGRFYQIECGQQTFYPQGDLHKPQIV